MISVKAEVSNVFAGKPHLKLYKEGTEVSAYDLVRDILPYLNDFDASKVLYGTEEYVLRSKGEDGEVIVKVDFSGYTSLMVVPECPDEWLKELEEKCRLVHTEFTRVSYPKSRMVVKELITY
jgi:hypothetical protein